MWTSLLIAVLAACALHVSEAVTCTSATGNTCRDTLFTTSSCSSDVCVCETGYSAVTTGCAVTAEKDIEKPVVKSASTGAVESGQVLDTKSITLKCDHNYTAAASPTYAWKKDGTADTSLLTAQTATVTVDSATFSHTYACTLTVNSVSIDSDTFTVTGYAATANAITAVPYVSGIPVSATSTETAITATCMNLPTEDDVKVVWTVDTTTDTAASATTKLITLSSTNFGKIVKCAVTTGTSSTVASESPTVTLPASFATKSQLEELDVVLYPGTPVAGGYMEVRCLVRATSLDGMSYHWKYDSQPIPGQIDHTLQLNAVTDANNGNSKTYNCYAKKDLVEKNDATASLSIAATVAVTLTDTTTYATGSTYTLTCASVSESPGIEYQWKRTVTGGSEETLADTGKTISIIATTTSTSYTCAARIGSSGSYGTATSGHAVLAVDVTAVAVTGPAKPLASTSVTYTCAVTKGDSVSVTYKWLDADSSDAEISGETSATYTFTAPTATTSKNIKCSATSTTSGATAVVSGSKATTSVATTDAPSISDTIPTIDSGEKIQDGGSYTLTCASDTATGQTATYEWTFTPTGGSATTLATTTSTYTISSASSANTGTYTCKVTVGTSQSAASSALTVARHAALGRTCSAIADCISEDLTLYTGNCINSICECMPGVTLSPTVCGTTSSGVEIASASVLMVLLSTVIMRFLF